MLGNSTPSPSQVEPSRTRGSAQQRLERTEFPAEWFCERVRGSTTVTEAARMAALSPRRRFGQACL
jgi:hypothetical protein